MSIEITRLQTEYRLRAELFLPQKIEELFPFFALAENLEQLTPPILKFKIVTSGEIEMGVGTVIDYNLRLHGLPLNWKTLISRWEPPYCFVDEQIRGPYRYWIHEHTFEEKDGGVLVKDLVRYQVLGGKLIHDIFVRKDLLKIFNFRQLQLKNKFS